MKTLIIIFLSLAVKLVNAAVWAYVILSWFVRTSPGLVNIYMTLARFIEPVLAPIRRLMEPLTYRIGLDFSPYVLVLIISFVSRFISRIVYLI